MTKYKYSYVALLTCDHEIVFEIPPSKGDYLWCIKCDAPSIVWLVRTEQAWKYYSSPMFKYRTDGTRYRGVCYECGVQYTGMDFYDLLKNARKHDWDDHSNSYLKAVTS